VLETATFRSWVYRGPWSTNCWLHTLRMFM
jgi:hypothetical protein